MMELYVELLIIAYISFELFEIRSIWNNWDKFAVAVHMLGVGVVFLFFVFVLWLATCGVKPLTMKLKSESYFAHLETV